jgi:hypothetical protein
MTGPFRVNVGSGSGDRFPVIGSDSTADGRLKLWDGDRWVQELRDGEGYEEAHPLMMKRADGWEQVCLMGIPAEGLPGIPVFTGDYPLWRNAPGAYTPTFGGSSRTFGFSGTYPYYDPVADTSYGYMRRINGVGGYGVGLWLDPWTPPAGKVVTDIQFTARYMVSHVSGTYTNTQVVQPYIEQDPNGPGGASQTAGNYFHPPAEDVWNTVTHGGVLSTTDGGLTPGLYWTDVPTGYGSLQDLVAMLADDGAGHGAFATMIMGSSEGGVWDLKVSFIEVRVTLAPA